MIGPYRWWAWPLAEAYPRLIWLGVLATIVPWIRTRRQWQAEDADWARRYAAVAEDRTNTCYNNDSVIVE